MIAANTIELTVVTPEKTLLNTVATSLQFPLEDGQIGILPGRAPMVGRLGTGELQVETQSGRLRYFIEGGFAQVKGHAVTLLTNRAQELGSFDTAKVEAAFNEALNRAVTTAAEQTAKDQDLERNRRLLAILKR